MSGAAVPGQLAMSFRAERPAGSPPMLLREPACARASGAWTRTAVGWRSDNGWELRPTHAVRTNDAGGRMLGWGAYAPDGLDEWWAPDVATAMERAEARP